MEEPKHRRPPDMVPSRRRPARRSTEIQPVNDEKQEDVALETYEQSPERPGGDERNRPTTPDGPMADRERATPD